MEVIMQELLNVENVLKVYPNGVVANKDVNLKLMTNEIHALIGENGAGKSTLMKILFGMERPDSGTITLNGEAVTIENSKKAIDLGIGMVHQHFMLVESLTIAENIVLGDEPTRGKLFLDEKEMLSLAREYNEKYQFNIDITKKVQDVSVGVKQKTEILKALVRGAKILILDEPTAVLTPQETTELFQQLKMLKKQGHTIVFISHKLNEIIELCDRVTIMRHGRTVVSKNICDTSVEDISRNMVGRDVVLKIEKKPMERGDVCLSARNLVAINDIGKRVVDHVSLDVYAGQILGVAGVEGNGQSELSDILSGMTTMQEGSFTINGKEPENYTPKAIRDCGLSIISEDRLKTGTAPHMSIVDNMFTNRIESFTKKGNIILDRHKMNHHAQKLVKEFEIVTDSINRSILMLSGGNMQKVVAARELLNESKVIIANQPTRGIDAGASELLRRKIIELRDQGKAIILISADLNEILELSDSVAVMYSGKLNAYFEDTKTLTEEELGYYMLGVKTQQNHGGKNYAES
ncbi:ABC transporter ATP-binding protein [Erysipelothrix rhusiopathiae]|uniref:ABC transporter, ATP-binding protein n=3 Tax=Erysipelothrix rhusiopathiae TaxID=1648 RepID=E7FX12_ERYRH|nr:ABC transporter ATP-binding protein [Erysipelothrix rhusiopathiae]AOO67170.1 ABC transporter ATP-binding protein [Erysipelothrix rhusiopathiae]EFY08787.1 ABC transporter, ATP-binding protein [Erysipelothrix rhusiopathiae ATCC 19414]